MFEIIKKLQSTDPERFVLDFNEHWTCYQTIEGFPVHYGQFDYGWISDRQLKRSLKEDKVWTVSVDREGAPWKPYSGYDLSDVLGRVAKEEGISLSATDYASDMDRMIYRIIGDRSDTNLSFSYNDEHDPDERDLLTAADRYAAEAGVKLWTVQWYPNTPIGCCLYSSLDLRTALKAMVERATGNSS